VFEQSLLLNDDHKKPWNFLASLSAEVLIISLALLIPLLYRDHLPAFHWNDVMVMPTPVPEPFPAVQTTSHTTGPSSRQLPRPFVFNLGHHAAIAPPPSTDLGIEAPPTLTTGLIGGETKTLGRFIPNPIASAPPPPPKPPAAVLKPPSTPLAVGGDVQMAKLLRKVIPEYPVLARSARISGSVRLIGTIGTDGTIRNLQLVSGHPLLARAAMEAVRQWIYKPTLLNGIPVEVIAPIEVNFSLAQ
jgi:protein TonB